MLNRHSSCRQHARLPTMAKAPFIENGRRNRVRTKMNRLLNQEGWCPALAIQRMGRKIENPKPEEAKGNTGQRRVRVP